MVSVSDARVIRITIRFKMTLLSHPRNVISVHLMLAVVMALLPFCLQFNFFSDPFRSVCGVR